MSTYDARYRKGLALRHMTGAPVLVSAVGTIRRLEALARLGYPRMMVLRRALGYAPSWRDINMWDRLRLSTAERIAAVYEELAAHPGPSARTRTLAARKGYAPPLAYDNIDDPHETPKGVV